MKPLAIIVTATTFALAPLAGAQELAPPGPGSVTIRQEVRPPFDTIDVHQTGAGVTVARHGAVTRRATQDRGFGVR